MVVWNERIKLLASFFNGIAITMFALGILAPIANILFQGGVETNAYMLAWWGLGAVILHGVASWALEDLQEE